VAIALVLASLRADAQRARVALAQPAAPDEIVAEVATRVRAELAAAAFDVVVVPLAPGANPREQVEAASLEPRPIATLAIVRIADRPAVDVWVYDRLTDKTSIKRLDLGRRPDPEIMSALAIHAVELLRASLLETRAAHASAKRSTTRPVPREVGDWVERAAYPPTALFEGNTIGIAGVVLHSFSGIGPAFAPAVRLAWGAPSGFAGRLSLVGPAFGANLESPKGTASVRQELAMVELVYAPTHHWISPFGSVGAGAYHLHTNGKPSDPNDRGTTDGVWAALLDAGGGVAARLGSGAAVTLELHAFVTQPSATVGIGDGADDARLGPTGRPSFIASLGLQSTF
jgi:hypothetical protein